MDVYKIGIEISMQNGVSSVLQTIQRQMLGLNAETMRASAAFGRLKLAIVGAAGAFVGVEILKGLSALTKHGEQYTHQLEMMKIAGVTIAEQQSAISTANRVSSAVMTSTPTGNLATIMELRNVLASSEVRANGQADNTAAMAEAVAHLETFQKISGIMSSRMSKDGKPYDGEHQAYELAKSAEMLGLSQDPKKFDAVLEGWTKALIASGGLLSGTDIFQNVKYLRGAGRGMDIDFLTQVLPSLAQEFKTGIGRGGGSGAGGGAGNPLNSWWNEIVAGKLTKKSLEAFEALDLVNETKIHRKKGGSFKADPGAVLGGDIASHNMYTFVTDVLEPAMRKHTHYLEMNKAGTDFAHPGELGGFMGMLAPNKTAQHVASIMLFQKNRIQGDIGLQQSSLGVEAAFNELRHDPVEVAKMFDQQLERLQTSIAVVTGITVTKTEFFYQLAKAMRYLAEAVEAHPLATKVILSLVVGLSGLLVALGSAAVAAAGISAITAIGISLPALGVAAIAITGIVATLTALNFPGGYEAIERIQHELDMFAKGLRANAVNIVTAINTFQDGLLKPVHDWGMKLKAGIAALWTDLVNGLEALVKNLRAWFANLPSRLWAAVSGSVMPSAVAAEPGATLPGPRVPPPAPQSSNLGTPGNPSHTYVTNQTSGADILHGAAGGMARSLSGPTSGTNWYDATMNPALQPLPY